jgi:alanyl-tRNA synthetase
MRHRLYYTEPTRREFDAVVTAAEADGQWLRVRLDRTAFYPTSGGQPHDTGTLAVTGDPARGVVRVAGVVESDEEGAIDHIVEGDLDAGQRVHGTIDWPRRFDHMQQHTGQHVLSAAFARGGAQTISFHLGTASSTIDLAREVSPPAIAEAERAANEVVWEDRPVAIRFVDAEEAASLPLRKEPARAGTLRLIDIQDFDLSACGGTHVARTGEVGSIAVRGWERFKGGSRIEFVCGRRALDAWRALRDAMTAATRLLSVLPHELPSGLERLQSENRQLERAVKDLSQRLAGFEGRALADRAVAAGPWRVVVDAVDGCDANGLEMLARGCVAVPGLAAVLFSTTVPPVVVAARSPDVAIDCQAIVRALVARFGGRGGGRPDRAQGGGFGACAADLVAAARELVAGLAGSA